MGAEGQASRPADARAGDGARLALPEPQAPAAPPTGLFHLCSQRVGPKATGVGEDGEDG